MKKNLIMLCLTAVLMFALSSVLGSCNKRYHSSYNVGSKDSTELIAAIGQYMNPTFANADEFTKYAADEADYQEFLNVSSFMELSTVENIAAIALKKHNNSIQWRDWLYEYQAHRQEYNTLDEVAKRKRGHICDEISEADDDTADVRSYRPIDTHMTTNITTEE